MAPIRPFAVERWFAEYEFHVDLNIAESCIKPLTLLEVSRITGISIDGLIGHEPLGYVDAAGSLDLRGIIAGFYPETTQNNVLITTGAIEANYILHRSLVQKGDRVICQWPAYQQLYEVARSCGAEVLFWKLRKENSFHPDIEELRALAEDGARLIVVNNPHNPTGAMLNKAELEQVAQIAEEAGAVLHVDEVYSGIFYEDEVPSARTIDPGIVITSSMSKAYGLPGVRLGYIAGPSAIVAQAACIRDYTSICPSFLSERIALCVLKEREAFLQRSMSIARTNLSAVESFVNDMSPLLSWVKPRAGVVCFPWYDLSVDSEQLCRRLCEEHSTLLVPGSCFEHTHHFRLGFGYDAGKLARGLERLRIMLQTM